MLMICIRGRSVLTEAPVIGKLVYVPVSLDMMVWLVSVSPAPTIAMTEELAGLRSIWLLKRVASTTLLGMP
jgi:hypothetical protein